MAFSRPRSRLNALLRALGFDKELKIPTYASWHDWLEAQLERKFAPPEPRAPATRGWHQPRRSRRKGPCYKKRIARALRRGADPNKPNLHLAYLGS